MPSFLRLLSFGTTTNFHLLDMDLIHQITLPDIEILKKSWSRLLEYYCLREINFHQKFL